MDITSFVLGYKKGKAGGGGATHPLHTVTFMSEYGSEELYKRSVVDGDDCADVVARGLLAAPAKASTAQYNYIYSGWSRVGGASASSDALASVTADRTVYAAFKSEVRVYTITYLDEDGSVLKTESLAYGAMPSYAPEKVGYDFDTWSPKLGTVTGDAIYTASWKAKMGLSHVVTLDTSGVSGEKNCAAVNNTGSLVVFGVGGSVSTQYIYGFNLMGESPTAIEYDAKSTKYWSTLAFNYNGKKLYGSGTASGSGHGTVMAVSEDGSAEYETYFYPNTGRNNIAPSPVSDVWAYKNSSQLVLSNGTKISINYRFTMAALSPDGVYLAYCSNSGTGTELGVKIYNITTGQLFKTVTTASTYEVSYNASGTMLALALSDAPYVEIYNTSTWEKICDLSGVVSSRCKIAMMGNDTLIVGNGTTVNAYTVASDGLHEFEYDKPTYSGGTIEQIHKSPDSSHIVFRYSNGLEVWRKG